MTNDIYINEKNYINDFLHFKTNLTNTQKYIKENFNIDSNFDEENGVLDIWNTSNNNEYIIKAKEYIENNIGLDKIQIGFGK